MLTESYNKKDKEMFNYKMLFIFLLISTSQVNAIALVGNAEGDFLVDVMRDSEGNVTDAGLLAGTTEAGFLSWGGSFGDQSSLRYQSEEFSITDNIPFKVATLTYSNTAIFSGTSFSNTFSSVALKLALDFSSPNSIDSSSFNYNLIVAETLNSSGTPEDSVTLIPTSGSNPLLVNSSGENFYFELLGFEGQTGSFNNFFIQQEGTSSTIDLYAKITAVPVPSALWLFMTALSGFIITGKQKRS